MKKLIVLLSVMILTGVGFADLTGINQCDLPKVLITTFGN